MHLVQQEAGVEGHCCAGAAEAFLVQARCCRPDDPPC